MSVSARARKAGSVLLTAAWAGLLTGLLHAAIVVVNLFLRGRLVFTSRDVGWLAPLGYVGLFLVPGVLLAVLALVAPRVVSLRTAVSVFVAIGVYCLTLPYESIAMSAALLLALGVGVQTARMLVRSEERALRRLSRQASTMAAAVLVICLLTRGWRVVAERQALATLPEAPNGAPHVLLVVLDTVRASSTSLYGYARRTTPRLERVGAEGVVFERAFSTAPWTLPSHATLFTGRYADELEADWRTPLSNDAHTLAEAFAAAGYATGGFTGNHRYTGHDSGLDQGFSRWEDFRTSWLQVLRSTTLGQTPVANQLVHKGKLTNLWKMLPEGLRVDDRLPSDPKYAPEVSRGFLEWQASIGTRPFFAFLNYFDAHEPIHAPPPYDTRFTPTPRLRDVYDGALAYLDDEIGAVLNELRRREVLDRTVVVIASDHGELLDEHGLRGHAHNLYYHSLHVPLLIRYPARIGADLRVAEPVSLRDLAATIVDLAGLGDPERFPGASLLSDAPARRSRVYASVSRGINMWWPQPAARGPMRTVLDDRYHYILNGDGIEELFEYGVDPVETRDLAGIAEGRARLPAYRAIVRERPGGQALLARTKP